MNEENNNERRTRSNRNHLPTKSKKQDRLLNYLIALVCVLIVVTAAYIFLGQDDVDNKVDDTPKASLEEDQEPVGGKETNKPSDDEKDDIVDAEEPTDVEDELDSSHQAIVEKPSDDPAVDSVIINPNWQPTPTSQTGA
ncbi:MAG: hypothetical protein RR595_10485, partial [Lysinibacillus sp.]